MAWLAAGMMLTGIGLLFASRSKTVRNSTSKRKFLLGEPNFFRLAIYGMTCPFRAESPEDFFSD
jgi:hypothetical protein